MSDLAKKNNGGETNGANGNGTNGNGTTGKIDTTGLSAAELYRLGRALCFGVYGVKIDKGRGVAILEAAVEAGKAADASEETRAAALDAQAELAEQLSEDFDGRSADWERAVELGNVDAAERFGFAYFDDSLGLARDEAAGGRAGTRAARNLTKKRSSTTGGGRFLRRR